MREGLWTSQLVYGGPGVGKSAYGVSGFWDWKGKKAIAPGRWVTFGREDNIALGVPEEMRRRFVSSGLRDTKWLDQFRQYVTGLVGQASKRKYELDAVVIDGMSELDLLFEESFKNENDSEVRKNKFILWNSLLTELFGIIQMLDPSVLGCHIIVTARVMEKKKAVTGKKGEVTIQGDPEFLNYDYYPSLRGQFRLHFPHYFHLVNYMETDFGIDPQTKLKVPIHKLHMLRTGDFYVKNQWEYQWIMKGRTEKEYAAEVVNLSQPEVVGMLGKL